MKSKLKNFSLNVSSIIEVEDNSIANENWYVDKKDKVIPINTKIIKYINLCFLYRKRFIKNPS